MSNLSRNFSLRQIYLTEQVLQIYRDNVILIQRFYAGEFSNEQLSIEIARRQIINEPILIAYLLERPQNE